MREDWLITDSFVETVSALELFAEELERVQADPYRWKWVIVSLHSGLQGMMVLALQGSHGLNVLRPEDAKRWLDAYERGEPFPKDLKLDDFLSLYKKVKSKPMLIFEHSRTFTPRGTQGASIKLLNRLRNEFIHFTPRVWALELAGLPKMASDCLDISEFLATESHNVLWRKADLLERVHSAFSFAHASFGRMSRKKRNT